MKHLKPALFLISALLITGCNNVSKESREEPKSEVVSSEDIPGGNPSSELVSSHSSGSTPAPISSENSSRSSTATSSGKTSTSTSKEDDPNRGVVSANIPCLVPGTKEGGYDINIAYDDTYFDNSATTFNDGLKMMSFGASLATTKEQLEQFYDDMDYQNITVQFPTPTENSIGYGLAYKPHTSYNLVAVSIRGFNYGAEWASNITVGKEGNHQGFNAKAEEVLTALRTYITALGNKSYKLWITGYSRGGAIANLLASKLMKDNFSKDNLFVYTFAAPRGVCEADAIEYENVFNLLNSNDLVARIPPQEYGLYRCGKDIIINTADKNIDEKIKELDENIELPIFTPSSGTFDTEADFTNFIVENLLQDTQDDTTNLNTREAFVNNYQDHIAYAIGLFFSMPSSTLDKIKTAFLALDTGTILGMLGSDDGLYNFIKPILDEDNFAYDDAKLQTGCATLTKLLRTKILILFLLASEDYKNDLMRMIYMHSPETVYVLIKDNVPDSN